jgi:GntR family transcriptional regulator, transcriptional repressor for pyruvate dehydrogenase complex
VTLTSLRRSPLVDLAVSQLREQVLSGQWPVGARLPAETELAQRLEVGRSTVREAVRALVHAGLLETRQGSGTYVRSVTPGSGWEPRLRRAAVLEVYEVRQALEVQAARLAAGRRTDADLAALHERLAERQTARDRARDAAFVESDLAFHRAVVAAAHNALLAEMFGSFAAVLREALIAVVSDRGLDTAGADPAHLRLAAAIEAGDAAAAERATHDHLDPTAAALRSLLTS